MPTAKIKSRTGIQSQCTCLTKASGFAARCRRASVSKERCSQHRSSPECRTQRVPARTPAPAHQQSQEKRKGVNTPRACFDFVSFSDEDVKEYLQQDAGNLVVVVDAGTDDQEVFCYTRRQLADTLRTNRRVFACATDTDRIEAAVPHKEFAPVQLRDAMLVHASTLQATMKQPENRVILLTRTGYVPRLVSRDVLFLKRDSSVGGRHCQPSSGGMTYAASVPATHQLTSNARLGVHTA